VVGPISCLPVNWRNIAIILIDLRFGEQTAQAGVNLWKAEMDRIRSLGAPVSELDFQPGIGRKEILANFSDAAEQGLTWSQARSRIGWDDKE